MKHITNTTALAGVALLALTACGPSEEEQALRDEFNCEDGETLDECGERHAEEVFAEADERLGTPDNEPTSEEVANEAAEDAEPIDNEGLAPKDMDFSDDPILADREFTGRMTGDVVAGIGEPVEVDQGSFEGIGDFMGTLTLDGAMAGYECTTATDELIEPQGQLLVVDITIAADAEADSEFYVSHSDFRWVGHDGDIAYYEMFECTSAVNSPSASVRPGETAQRTLLFDVPEFEGSLSYTDATNYVDFEIEQADYDNADRIPDDAL